MSISFTSRVSNDSTCDSCGRDMGENDKAFCGKCFNSVSAWVDWLNRLGNDLRDAGVPERVYRRVFERMDDLVRDPVLA